MTDIAPLNPIVARGNCTNQNKGFITIFENVFEVFHIRGPGTAVQFCIQGNHVGQGVSGFMPLPGKVMKT